METGESGDQNSLAGWKHVKVVAQNRHWGWKQVREGPEPSLGIGRGEGGAQNRQEGWKQVKVVA
jgi:hypothetical protein